MNHMQKFIFCGFGVLSLSLFPLPASAQTPDGQTPAEETVCDPLRATGVTKGLYGLCVAFCEAQDIASVDEPITQDQLAALEASAPSGKILNAYNRKKRDADPHMPCILVQEPCPCWSEEEIAEIDGNFDGNPINKAATCTPSQSPFGTLEESPPFLRALTLNFPPTNIFLCQWTDTQTMPTITRTLQVPDTLTLLQFQACLDSIQIAQRREGFCGP